MISRGWKGDVVLLFRWKGSETIVVRRRAGGGKQGEREGDGGSGLFFFPPQVARLVLGRRHTRGSLRDISCSWQLPIVQRPERVNFIYTRE